MIKTIVILIKNCIVFLPPLFSPPRHQVTKVSFYFQNLGVFVPSWFKKSSPRQNCPISIESCYIRLPARISSPCQRGNAFFFVLLGVVMFAALAFTVSRGLRSDTTSQMTGQKASLAASDILAYAQKMERGINRIRRRSVSENDISFANAVVAGYEHSPAQPDKHKLFHPSGGNISWQSPQENANDGSPWHFTGESCIAAVGTGDTSCDSNGDPDEDLLAVLPNLAQGICTEINKKLGITGIPANAGSGYSTVPFTGTYSDGTLIDNMDGLKAGCFNGGASQPGFHFYQVLLAR